MARLASSSPACLAPPRPSRGCLGCCPEVNTLPQTCPRGGGINGRGAPGPLDARLVAPFLSAAVGSDEVAILFNLGGWMKNTRACAFIREGQRIQLVHIENRHHELRWGKVLHDSLLS